MEYNDLINEAISEFPELLEEYKEECEKIIYNKSPALPILSTDFYEVYIRVHEQIVNDNKIPFVYQFYEDIVRHHFVKLVNEHYIDKTNNDIIKKIEKMACFFEKMACSGAPEVENVLSVGIFEVMDDKDQMKSLLPLLKEKSRALLNDQICRT